MNSDSPGPGQYEPDVSITRKALSTATFAKGKQGRDCFNMAKDSFSRPGPGQYETGLVTEDEVVRPSPVFLSATTRDKKAKEGKDGSLKHETPGPGSYQVCVRNEHVCVLLSKIGPVLAKSKNNNKPHRDLISKNFQKQH